MQAAAAARALLFSKAQTLRGGAVRSSLGPQLLLVRIYASPTTGFIGLSRVGQPRLWRGELLLHRGLEPWLYKCDQHLYLKLHHSVCAVRYPQALQSKAVGDSSVSCCSIYLCGDISPFRLLITG
jgi:hypothetical protein